MASPSLDSISRESTIGAYINDHIDYLSVSLDETSPLTVSESSSPPNQLSGVNSTASSSPDCENAGPNHGHSNGNGNGIGIGNHHSHPNNLKLGSPQSLQCKRHKNEQMKHFCLVCLVPTCQICNDIDHRVGFHTLEPINDVAPGQIEIMAQSLANIRQKITEVQSSMSNIDLISNRIQGQYSKAVSEINETAEFYRSMLEEKKSELFKDLENIYSSKQVCIITFF